MKNLFITLAACAMLLCTTACSDEATPLTASKAKSALKEEALFAKDSHVNDFRVGYFEVNRDQLQRLAILKAAGMIEYSAEKVIETTYKRVGWYSTVREITTPHVFVQVSLTKEGEKYVVEKPTTKSKRDEDPNEGFEPKLPEYTNAVDNTFDIEENVVIEEECTEELIEENEVVAADYTQPASTPAADTKVDKNARYKACLARVSYDEVKVLLGRFDIEKVRDIRCTEDMLKNGIATCNVLAKFTDVTPFGYALSGHTAGYIYTIDASFEYYQDCGWTVNKLN